MFFTSALVLSSRIGAGIKEEFKTAKDYDVFLAELVFSQSDVRDDVLKNLDKAADEGWVYSRIYHPMKSSRSAWRWCLKIGRSRV